MTYLMFAVSLSLSIWSAIFGQDPSAYTAAALVIGAIIGSKP